MADNTLSVTLQLVKKTVSNQELEQVHQALSMLRDQRVPVRMAIATAVNIRKIQPFLLAVQDAMGEPDEDVIAYNEAQRVFIRGIAEKDNDGNIRQNGDRVLIHPSKLGELQEFESKHADVVAKIKAMEARLNEIKKSEVEIELYGIRIDDLPPMVSAMIVEWLMPVIDTTGVSLDTPADKVPKYNTPLPTGT